MRAPKINEGNAMNYFEREQVAGQHISEATKAVPGMTTHDNAAMVQAILALAQATLAVAARTGSGHCENCCQY